MHFFNKRVTRRAMCSSCLYFKIGLARLFIAIFTPLLRSKQPWDHMIILIMMITYIKLIKTLLFHPTYILAGNLLEPILVSPPLKRTGPDSFNCAASQPVPAIQKKKPSKDCQAKSDAPDPLVFLQESQSDSGDRLNFSGFSQPAKVNHDLLLFTYFSTCRNFVESLF